MNPVVVGAEDELATVGEGGDVGGDRRATIADLRRELLQSTADFGHGGRPLHPLALSAS